LSDDGILVFTDAILGTASDLVTTLNSTAIDTTNIGNKVVLWTPDTSGAPGIMYIGVLNNTDTADNNSVSITTVGILGFEDNTELGIFQDQITASNFDLL
jgi:hypothetical protein